MARRGVLFLLLGAAGAMTPAACGDHRGRLQPATGGTNGDAGHAGETRDGGGTGGRRPAPGSGGADAAGGVQEPGAGGGFAEGGAGAFPPVESVCIFHTPADGPTVSRAAKPKGDAGAGGEAGGLVGGGTTAGGGRGNSGSKGGTGGTSSGAGGTLGGTLGTSGAVGTAGREERGEGGDAGAGGAGPHPNITVQRNAFTPAYLADAAGRALYVFGADLAGDCDREPESTCYDDCKLSWPVFDAGERLVADTLDDAQFGAFERADGLRQTTYRGWPLYYYKNDTLPGDVRGQGVGRIWHLAEVALPNVVVLRIDTVRYLADEFGHVLYTHEADTQGSADAEPRSACLGSCTRDFPPFSPEYLAPVTYLEESAFSVFVRDDGRVQQSYKGWPLYRSSADEHAGDRNGSSVAGWIEATP